MKKFVSTMVMCFLFVSLVLAQGPSETAGQSSEGTSSEGTIGVESNGSEQGQSPDAPVGIGTQIQNEGEESQIQEQEQAEINSPMEGEQIQNQGQIQEQIQVQEQVQEQVKTRTKLNAGTYTTENGKQLQVEEKANNQIQLRSGMAQAQTSMEMVQEQTQEGTKLQVKLSNGKNAEVKIMPDTASEKALEQLKIKVCSEENDCQIELKEVGSKENIRAAYEVQLQKQAKLLGLFRTKMQVQAQVDAENGEVIQVKKPWWAFLASESEY